jgi:glycerophosphoryl diester phosphodiesterase
MNHSRFLHLVAHRGNADEFPENTLPAIASALELGVRFIAVDVQVSGNGIPMAMRDCDLTALAGIAGDATQMTAAELAQIDASEPQRFGDRFKGTCIPRLIDVLGLLGRRPEATAFIIMGRASLIRIGHDQVVAQVLETLKPYRSRCILVSPDLPAIYRARQMAGVPIGWIIGTYDQHTRLKCEALQPEYLFCDRMLLPVSGNLWRGPWRWVIQDVPTLEHALKLAERGAHFIATSSVRAVSEAMRAYAGARPRNRDETFNPDDTYPMAAD